MQPLTSQPDDRPLETVVAGHVSKATGGWKTFFTHLISLVVVNYFDQRISLCRFVTCLWASCRD
mgnify:CR=1 FL=1